MEKYIYLLLLIFLISYLFLPKESKVSIVFAASCSGYIGTECCDWVDPCEHCIENVDWGYCGGVVGEFCNSNQPANCTDFWSDLCCCNGTAALNCIPPSLEKPFDFRNMTNSCNRTSAAIDCNGITDNHHVCSNIYYPPENKCALMEPSINSYSVSKSSIIKGESFYINVNGNCPRGLPGKCLVECRVVNPDGNFTELDTWSADGNAVTPSVTCNQLGDYVVDYCLVYTDFRRNSGWGDLTHINTTVSCTLDTQCNDGKDNDADSLIDGDDPDCTDINDNTECADAGNSCSIDENCCSGLVCSDYVCKISDSTPPNIAISSPSPSSWQRTDFSLTYSVTDNKATDKCNLSLKDGSAKPWSYMGSIPCGSSQKTITVGFGKNCSVQGSNQCSIRIAANDTSGNSNMYERNFSVDYTNPIYLPNEMDDSGGSAREGTIVNVSTYWQDNVNLHTVGVYHNISGDMRVNSTCYIASLSGWCNSSISTTGFSGKACWYQIATDFSNNLNDTMKYDVHCFTVIASSSESSSIGTESVLESVTRYISSYSAEFSLRLVTLVFQFFGIIILVVLLIIVVQNLVQSL